MITSGCNNAIKSYRLVLSSTHAKPRDIHKSRTKKGGEGGTHGDVKLVSKLLSVPESGQRCSTAGRLLSMGPRKGAGGGRGGNKRQDKSIAQQMRKRKQK